MVQVTKMSAASQVYTQLRQALIDGVMRDGEMLTENGLAARYGVSRTPVREALGRLEHDGLVQRESRGFIVRRRSPEEIIQIYDARILLEGAAARAAAERRTLSDLSLLQGIAAEELRVARDDPAQRVTMNQRFHQAIWAASHHATFQDLLERLSVHLVRYPTTTLHYDGRWDAAVKEHEQLIAAIAAQDGERAERIARLHMERARDVRLAMWREEPPSS